MQVINYKEVDLSKLVLSKPERLESEKVIYTSNLYFDKVLPCIIQTPNLIYNKKEKKLAFDLNRNPEFYSLIEQLKDRITEILYNNSEKFFKGKKFSYNWIYKATSNIIEIDCEGKANIPNIDRSDTIKIFDHFKEPVEKDDFEEYEGIFILNIKNIEFSGKSIQIKIDIDAVKLKFKREIITDVCLLEDSDSEKDINEEIPDDISESDTESLLSEQDFFS